MRYTFEEVAARVLAWGEARRITINGTSPGQAKKTVEEANELLAAVALDKGDPTIPRLGHVKDGVGDTLVTLLMVCAIEGLDIVDCLEAAYQEIKDRRGEMGADGIFYRVGQMLPDGRIVE